MEFETKLDPKDAANFVVGGALNRAADMANAIPFLRLGDKLRESPTITGLASGAQDAIVKAGSDETSFFGKIFQWVAGLFSSLMSGLNDMLGIKESPEQAAPTGAKPPAEHPAPTDPAAAKEAARLAAEQAQLPPTVTGGTPATAPQSPTVGQKPPASIAQAQK